MLSHYMRKLFFSERTFLRSPHLVCLAFVLSVVAIDCVNFEHATAATSAPQSTLLRKYNECCQYNMPRDRAFRTASRHSASRPGGVSANWSHVLMVVADPLRTTLQDHISLRVMVCQSFHAALSPDTASPKGAPSMRARLGASEADVERVNDDALPAHAPASGTPQQPDSDPSDIDSENVVPRQGRKRGVTRLSKADEGDVDESTRLLASDVAHPSSIEGDVSAPDLVQDLGTWDDDAWQ